MGTTDVLLRVMAIALIGWLATSYRIMRSNLPTGLRRGLIVPFWFIWMAFGLGGPVYTGALPLHDALSMCGSFTVGMSVYLLLFSLRQGKRSR